MNVILGERIFIYRRRRGMSQKELADAVGVSASSIGRYERDNAFPDDETLKKICRALNVDELYQLNEIILKMY